MDPCRPPGTQSTPGSSARRHHHRHPANSATSRWPSYCPCTSGRRLPGVQKLTGDETQNWMIWIYSASTNGRLKQQVLSDKEFGGSAFRSRSATTAGPGLSRKYRPICTRTVPSVQSVGGRQNGSFCTRLSMRAATACAALSRAPAGVYAGCSLPAMASIAAVNCSPMLPPK